MQTDVGFKKEQNGTLFALVEVMGGGRGGGWSLGGVQAKSYTCRASFFCTLLLLSCILP